MLVSLKCSKSILSSGFGVSPANALWCFDEGSNIVTWGKWSYPDYKMSCFEFTSAPEIQPASPSTSAHCLQSCTVHSWKLLCHGWRDYRWVTQEITEENKKCCEQSVWVETLQNETARVKRSGCVGVSRNCWVGKFGVLNQFHISKVSRPFCILQL